MTTQIQARHFGKAIPSSNKLAELNAIIRKRTCFSGMLDLTRSSKYCYRPTLNCLPKPIPENVKKTKTRNKILRERAEIAVIADRYDAMMHRLGVEKTAFRI